MTVQLMRVALPLLLTRPPPHLRRGVSADGAVGERGRATKGVHAGTENASRVAADGTTGQGRRAAPVVKAAAVVAGGVAAHGAVGQLGCAVGGRQPARRLARPPPLLPAELPLTVQLVSVVVL